MAESFELVKNHNCSLSSTEFSDGPMDNSYNLVSFIFVHRILSTGP
jgi:hypothetical protein